MTLVEFMKRVGKTDTCWLWLGNRTCNHTRPCLWIEGKMVYAYRLAYELMTGPILTGLKVLHKCDNPMCVNPAHLFLGTQEDNMHDMRRKGRSARGEGHPQRKLTDDQVRYIRRVYIPRHPEFGGKALGMKFGIGNASAVAKGRVWSHVKSE
jgi:hypothetical protein